jgi:hydroxyacylglutathione hydrolase
MSMPIVTLVPCLSDNYCVLLHSTETGTTLAIDAPHADTIKATLADRGWHLNSVLVTHHHNDHTAGCQALKDHFGCTVIGPDEEGDRIACLSATASDGATLLFDTHSIRVMATPGHTLGHVSYYFPSLGLAFTGDTLFVMGCGRLFEGDAHMMHASLSKIAALPDETRIYCGHEYTLQNARFAASVEPENSALMNRIAEIESLRKAGKPTLPTTVALEKATNPFLRTSSLHIRTRLGLVGAPDWQVLQRLRELKNKA